MKTPGTPLHFRHLLPDLALAVAFLALAGYVFSTRHLLPERVATHFGLGGEPNGWMMREQYVKMTLLLSFGVPLFIVALFVVVRLANGAGCNLPHREYWLAPERKAETLRYLETLGGWFACLSTGFFAGLYGLVLQANSHSPARLSNGSLSVIAGAYLAASIVGMVQLVRHFRRLPAGG